MGKRSRTAKRLYKSTVRNILCIHGRFPRVRQDVYAKVEQYITGIMRLLLYACARKKQLTSGMVITALNSGDFARSIIHLREGLWYGDAQKMLARNGYMLNKNHV